MTTSTTRPAPTYSIGAIVIVRESVFVPFNLETGAAATSLRPARAGQRGTVTAVRWDPRALAHVYTVAGTGAAGQAEEYPATYLRGPMRCA